MYEINKELLCQEELENLEVGANESSTAASRGRLEVNNGSER
jgi:hypothetical protein